uniref:MMS19 nucleotide excision repair protein n=1 Tax=Quercus lobata TaxID=97700 RepID=A0A7N2LN05_QUELO
MAEPSQVSHLIESFVDSSRSPTQQEKYAIGYMAIEEQEVWWVTKEIKVLSWNSASLDKIASLVKNDVLTMEGLVREMQMYLTTTDNIVHARGILLLAEVLTCLATKALDNATLHSLIGFFADRLADWKALRGALVGCLALMRRKSSAGVVTSTDAKAVAKSFLQNLQVQSLGQHDRKGDELIYGICEAVDSEKDPQCLMLTFHIVEVLPRGEDLGIKRDDLSQALMQLYVPHSSGVGILLDTCLLLEKLSSSLPSAKENFLTWTYFEEGQRKSLLYHFIMTAKLAYADNLQTSMLQYLQVYEFESKGV